MARPRSIPDDDIFAAIRTTLARDGERAVAFGMVAQITGLAAPSLVQRYGTRDGMVRAALLDGWQKLAARTAELDDPQPHGLLKSLTAPATLMADPALMAVTLRDPALAQAAQDWRAQVETLLALRLGGGTKGREAAAVLFAAWMGQMQWLRAGGKGFRLKDAAKRIT